jgi:deazaflavin-dependent oxidoreductase (nitroreductase family)
VPRQYRLSAWRRAVNAIVRRLVRTPLAPPHTYLLTVRGRRTGDAHTTPVYLIEQGAERWLVAPYGEVGWVRNARAAGEVTLRRRGRTETVKVEELGAEDSAPILREYVREVPVVRPFFAAKKNAPVEQFAAEAAAHPVFRLVATTAAASNQIRNP